MLAEQAQAQEALAAIAAAAAARCEAFSRQQLADVAWAVAHCGGTFAAPLEAGMKVPFRVLPCQLPNMHLEVRAVHRPGCLRSCVPPSACALAIATAQFVPGMQ